MKEDVNLYIAAVNGTGRISVSAMNIAGVQVMAKEVRATGQKTNYKMDLSTLENGVYVIILRFEDGSSNSKKVIKEGTR